jgi:hypothetical protein
LVHQQRQREINPKSILEEKKMDPQHQAKTATNEKAEEDTPMKMYEQELTDIDPDKLEESLNK